MGPWLIPLISAVPDIIHMFTGGASSTGAVVQQLGNIAMKVTGAATPDAASAAVAADPAIALQFKTAVLAQQVQLAQIAAQKEKDDADAANEATKALTDRIATLEGTAADLKGIPILGPVMLFFRGAQRPVIGYAMMYLDYMVFSGLWKVAEGAMTNLFWLMNALVLAFLFGERAVTNIAPLLTNMIQAKYGNASAEK